MDHGVKLQGHTGGDDGEIRPLPPELSDQGVEQGRTAGNVKFHLRFDVTRDGLLRRAALIFAIRFASSNFC